MLKYSKQIKKKMGKLTIVSTKKKKKQHNEKYSDENSKHIHAR